MLEDIAELLVELAGTVVYPAVATVLTAVGALAELAGIQNLQAGESLLGGWEVFIGLVLLYAAVSIFREYALPAVRGEDAA